MRQVCALFGGHSISRQLPAAARRKPTYAFGEDTLRPLVACFPKGGHYHAETRTTRPREGEALATIAPPVATQRPDRPRLLCRTGAERTQFLRLATRDRPPRP